MTLLVLILLFAILSSVVLIGIVSVSSKFTHDGFAGELGHVILKRKNGRLCGCGRTGCLEAYASATGVARTAREYLSIRKDESILRELDPEEITSKDVYDAAMKDDPIAKEIFEFTGTILGEAFADFVAFSSPEAIIMASLLSMTTIQLKEPLPSTSTFSLLSEKIRKSASKGT